MRLLPTIRDTHTVCGGGNDATDADNRGPACLLSAVHLHVRQQPDESQLDHQIQADVSRGAIADRGGTAFRINCTRTVFLEK